MGNASNVIGGALFTLTHGGHGGLAPDGTCCLLDGRWSTHG